MMGKVYSHLLLMRTAQAFFYIKKFPVLNAEMHKTWSVVFFQRSFMKICKSISSIRNSLIVALISQANSEIKKLNHPSTALKSANLLLNSCFIIIK